MPIVKYKPSVIEWFDDEIERFYGGVIDTLRSEGHKVRVNDKVTPQDIERLKDEHVGLIVVELNTPGVGLGKYSTGGQSCYAVRKGCPMYHGDIGGLQLLESICWSYNANTVTPKAAFTSMAEMNVTFRASVHIPHGNYMQKPEDGQVLAERIRLMLPRQDQ